jgi:UDP-glucose 4-epimerase
MINNLLITGGAGYIGSHAVRMLIKKGYEVVVLDNLSQGHRDALDHDVPFIFGDFGDQCLVKKILYEYRIDAIVHFAAESIVPQSLENPLNFYRSNVSKTIELIAAAISAGVFNFIFSSTASVYGEPKEIPITELHPAGAINPYGISKWMIEQILEDCHKAHGLKYVSLRYFNAAGADESGKIGESHNPETHLIPLVLDVALGKSPAVKIYGTDYDTPDGTCIRDYIHVNDLCEAHILAVEAIENGIEREIYNLGNGEGYSVREVIEVAERVTRRPIPVEEAERRKGDPSRLVASFQKIQKELGWKPAHPDLEYIIETAWKWHQNRRY